VEFQNLALAEWVAKLHPTPAVGGIPLAEGMSFLQQNENLDRAYYAGFLGPVTTAGNTELFVNLRCAKISNGQISLYVGAGITKDSDPKQEWEETQNKAKTLWTALP
jgi:isochorismate synthase